MANPLSRPFAHEEDDRSRIDPVDEAALESFPASDRPAFNPLRVGDPTDHADKTRTEAREA